MRGLLVAKTANTDAFVARAVLRETRTTPQKARRVVNIVRGERADTALTTLKFANQEIASELYTLLASAVANAKQKNPSLRDASELWVAEALVDEGFTLKRFRPRAQGRGFTIRKRTSTITFVVSDDRNYRSNGPRKVVKHAPVVKEVVKPVAAVATDSATTTAPAASTAKKAAAKKAPAKKAPAKKAVAKEGKAE
jgi:large subunit ribosomal protein L22